MDDEADESADESAGAVARLNDLASGFPGRYGGEPALRDEIRRVGAHLRDPVRVAVAGCLKSGKSTLLNALLRRDVVATGTLETTFRVCELRAGRAEGVRVFHGQGYGDTGYTDHGLDELARFSARDGADPDLLRRISRIIVTLANDFLADVTLIDTPGLGSVHGEDSANAELALHGRLDDRTVAVLDRLGLTAEQVSLISEREANRADGLLYVFRHDAGRVDLAAVEGFLGSDARSRADAALRTIGVLSQCDLLRGVDGFAGLDADPIEEFARQRIARRFDRDSEAGRLFPTVVPVAALVADGAYRLDAERYADLAQLARLPPETLLDEVNLPARFGRAGFPGAAPAPERRRRLMAELGPWGTLLAYRYVRDGCRLPELRERLDADSGVAELRLRVRDHFGGHAYLVKLGSGLAGIREQARVFRDSLPARPSGDTLDRLDDLGRRLARLERDETGFAEVAVRRAIGAGELQLPADDADRARRLAGGSGRSCARRLGRADGTPPEELERLAVREVAYWQRRQAAALRYDEPTRAALDTLLDLAEDVARRVRTARRLLSWHLDPTG